ncbi:MAG: hypothetical protein QM820_08055 [Minicystis sp.]
MASVIAAARPRPPKLAGRDPRGARARKGGVDGAIGALRDMTRKLFAITVAALVVVGALTAGRSYLWCAMMERAVEACCCEPEDDGATEHGAEIHSACCEDHLHAGLDKARVGASTIEIPAAMPADLAPPSVSLAALTPAPSFAPPRARATARARPIRAGPTSAADTCVLLQVFRC